MKQVKDNFSKQAALYQKYRPDYPQALYDLIFSHCQSLDLAWDCATGNGQVAKVLADKFNRVVATDISDEQLSHAPSVKNIEYKKARAEDSHLGDQTVDLITVGQAIHWFDFDKFYPEAQRVLKPEGIFAAWTYGVFQVDDEINEIVQHFYKDVVGAYWDPERTLIDEEYKTIPFPFREIDFGEQFTIERHWSIEDIHGYLNTWSSVAHYRKQHSNDPVEEIIARLKPHWRQTKTVKFPVFLRLGTNGTQSKT